MSLHSGAGVQRHRHVSETDTDRSVENISGVSRSTGPALPEVARRAAVVPGLLTMCSVHPGLLRLSYVRGSPVSVQRQPARQGSSACAGDGYCLIGEFAESIELGHFRHTRVLTLWLAVENDTTRRGTIQPNGPPRSACVVHDGRAGLSLRLPMKPDYPITGHSSWCMPPRRRPRLRNCSRGKGTARPTAALDRGARRLLRRPPRSTT